LAFHVRRRTSELFIHSP